MINYKLFNKIEKFVKSNLSLDVIISGHGWDHSYRVFKMCREIINNDKIKNIDDFIIDISSLLHDISDHKFNGGDYELGSKIISPFLKELNIDNNKIEKIKHIINNISYSKKDREELSIEGKIIRDSDMLDSMGAIGIARTFAYGAKESKMIYDLNLLNTSIVHFSDKLFKLKDLMYTEYAKRIAEKRHEFLKLYYLTFFREINMEE